MQPGRTLAAFVAETPFEAIPGEVVEAIRIDILDNLACGFAGAPHRWSNIVAGLVATWGGTNSMFGRRETASPSAAALFNGVCIGGFETDHVFSPGAAHPGGAVFPAALAAAEHASTDGRSLFTAIALGYEALCRVGAAATRAVEEERGFHGPSTNAPIGAAFGASRALRLSVDDTLSAAGIAGSHAGGLLEFSRDGAMTKRLHLGRGSQMGLESALLARGGFTGPATGIEGEHGYLRTYSPAPNIEALTAGLGTDWLALGVSLKAFPCHATFQPVVDAIWRWRQDGAVEASAIRGVRIQSEHRMASPRFDVPTPTSSLGAQISLPWAVAVSLLRDPGSPAAWGEETLDDPGVRAMAASVEIVREAPADTDAVAEVTILTDTGEHTLGATDWEGAPTRPYTFAGMAEKFRRYADGQASPARIEEMVERTAALEREPDAAAFASLIRPS